MFWKLLKVAVWLGAGLLVLVLGFVGFTYYKFGRAYDAPLPDIQRSTSPETIARGEKIFGTVCVACHLNDDGTVRGRHLDDFPPPFGSFNSANITSDPVGGIGGWSDQEVARMIRSAIGQDGKLRPMPAFQAMGDSDVQAVVSFIRSGNPIFKRYPEKSPKSQVSLVGHMVFTWVFGIHPNAAAAHIPVPAKAPTVEYGRYMAQQFDCHFCHTDGFSANKIREPGLFSGGFEFPDKAGLTVNSPNITMDAENGIGKWSAADFIKATREGITPDGRILRLPMPHFRYSDDEELTAIYRFIETVPKSSKPRKVGTLPVARAGSGGTDPEAMWRGYGCVACHGDSGPFKAKIKQCIGKPIDQVAAWIRNPQATKPGTQMPTFASVIDEPTSKILAAWVQARATAMP